MEVLFSTMGVREFTYNFNFAPRNQDETAEIQQIIQLFRFHMAPELQAQMLVILHYHRSLIFIICLRAKMVKVEKMITSIE